MLSCSGVYEITENVRTVAEGMTEELGEQTKESKPMGSRGVGKGRRV
jgi:hypothetical protein